ncbi:MAG: hypothetical protein K2X81_14815 [Candidatus Obscuribacterales bacterium]|nr:hypothetical protein [Candidatus Obscuribacterales bacterium]
MYKEADASIERNSESVRRLIFCSGKIYYELVDERIKRGIKDIAIVRIEQLAPFPWDKVAEECAFYANAEVMWVQEEPKNMGPWSFVQPRISTATRTLNGIEKRPVYSGREPAAATATGLGARVHNAEQAALIDVAFS